MTPSEDIAAARAGAILEIDLDAIAANYARLQQEARGISCAAVLKADAYGLGIAPVATRLAGAGCREFFVAHLTEGIELRGLLPDASIRVLNGLFPHCAADYTAHDLIPVLNDRGQIDAWAAHCRNTRAQPAAIQFDTGMHRLGLPPAEAGALLDDPAPLEAFSDILIMSHLACADVPDHPLNIEQRDRFAAIGARMQGRRTSFANSAGLFLGPEYHGDLARPGIALYGGNPVPGRANPMRAVVGLKGRILQVRQIDAPGAVGYGASHSIAPSDRLATVALGDDAGYLRSIGNRGHAYVGDVRVPVVGRVSMDLITLDVTDVPEEACRTGDWVDLLDERHTVDDLAEEAGTIGYEILTALGGRYHRVYRGKSDTEDRG